MHPLVVHLASGQAFFSGTALIAIAVIITGPGMLRLSFGRTGRRSLAAMLSIMGVVLVLLSGTPVPIPIAIPWITAFLGWLVLLRRPGRPEEAPRPRLKLIPWGLLVLCLAAIAAETPWRFSPGIRPVRERSFTLIADSISAGLGEQEAVTWPNVLSQDHAVHVVNWSRQGETVGSALRRAPQSGVTTQLVVLEIGGNDLLGPTSDEAFEQGLDALLAFTRRGDATGTRQIIMFELPLPPFRHAIGAIQRRLARKHDVRLIPKSVLLNVIAGTDATVDGLHLSQIGHNQMAAAVWEIIGPALP